MPTPEVVDRFVAAVTGGDYVGAIERFYVEGASMRENLVEPRVGREGLMRHEAGMMAAFQAIGCEIVGPPLIAGDHVAVRWKFAFTPHDGPTRTLREIAWQRWDGDRIAEETFFYDPAQMAAA